MMLHDDVRKCNETKVACDNEKKGQQVLVIVRIVAAWRDVLRAC
jgi:hypothetical protein